jgi:hypothetical protein
MYTPSNPILIINLTSKSIQYIQSLRRLQLHHQQTRATKEDGAPPAGARAAPTAWSGFRTAASELDGRVGAARRSELVAGGSRGESGAARRARGGRISGDRPWGWGLRCPYCHCSWGTLGTLPKSSFGRTARALDDKLLVAGDDARAAGGGTESRRAGGC